MMLRLSGARTILVASTAFCCGVLMCSATRAEDFGSVYIGANFGRALNTYNTGFIDQQYEGQASAASDALGVTGRSVHRFDWVWWGDVAYFFTPYVALDAAYLHLGEVRYKSADLASINGVQNAASSSTEVTSRGPALSLIGRLPLIDSFEVDLRAGGYFGKTGFFTNFTTPFGSSTVTTSKTTTSLLAGVGVAYTIAGHWTARLDYLRVNKTGDSATSSKFSVNVGSVGVGFTF